MTVDAAAVTANSNQQLKELSTLSDRDARSFSEKLTDFLAQNPGRDNLAIASKSIVDLANNHSILPDYALVALRRDDAREALGQFIREAHKAGLRCVRVVHGKGLGSPGRMPVLKGRVQRWLVQKNEVLAFVQARPADGGAGAMVVLLRPA